MHGLYFLYSFLQDLSYQDLGYIFSGSILFIMIDSNVTGDTCLRIIAEIETSNSSFIGTR